MPGPRVRIPVPPYVTFCGSLEVVLKVGAPPIRRRHRSSPTPTTLLLKTSTARLDTPERETTPDHAQHTSSKSAPPRLRSHSRSSPTPTTLLLKTSTARLDTPEHQSTPGHAQHTSSQPQPGSSARAPDLEPVLHATRALAQPASSRPATPALSSMDPGTAEHRPWHTIVVPAALESRSRRT